MRAIKTKIRRGLLSKSNPNYGGCTAASILRQKSVRDTVLVLGPVFVSVLIGASPAHAFDVPTGNADWSVRFDNTITYDLGMRAEGIDPKIGNSPALQAGDYKFASAGDIVTNRLEDLIEFDVAYQQADGIRLSALAWRDFAYDNAAASNPGNFAPGLPYSALSAYPGGHYSNYTDRYYIQSAQLQDAFAFANFDLSGHNTAVKVGRLVEYWGNSVFFGSQGIDYGQNASNNIKLASQPGTPTKELAIPRTQAFMQIQALPELAFSAQYFGEFYHDQEPEGGTYLEGADFLFNGPQSLLGTPRSPDTHAGAFHANYGLKAAWTPDWLRGTVAAYYRHFDDPTPVVLGRYAGAAPSSYYLYYPTNNQLYGVSLDKQIGDYSYGFEVSYRHNTALGTNALSPTPAMGDTVNVIANVLAGLTPTPVYDTGTLIAEIALTHKISVTENKASYDFCTSSTSPTSNCATTNYLVAAGQFDPTWPQLLPGLDVDAPFFIGYGIAGNSPSNGAGIGQGQLSYTAGIHGLFRQIYNITLQYNGYSDQHGGLSTTPAGAQYYTNAAASADKNWVSLTVSATF
jgi:hypothetical protein